MCLVPLHFQFIHASKAHQGNRKTFGMGRLENPFLLGKSSYICFDQFKHVSTYLFRSCPNKKMIMTVGFLHWRYGICTSVYLTAMNMLVSHDRWLSALFLIRTQHTTRYIRHIKHIQYPVESPHSLSSHRERCPGFVMRCYLKSSVVKSCESI